MNDVKPSGRPTTRKRSFEFSPLFLEAIKRRKKTATAKNGLPYRKQEDYIYETLIKGDPELRKVFNDLRAELEIV